MKTRILITLFLFSPLFFLAQGIGIGAKVGANFANFSTDDADTESIVSYHVGAYANFKLSEKFGITPEILWSSQGADIENVEFKTNYVTVPVMLRWRIIDLISLEAGPQFNVLTSAKADGQDVTDDYESPSYCLAFGALCHLPLGFNGGLRFVTGLTDLSKEENFKLKEQNFQLWVGWTILGAN